MALLIDTDAYDALLDINCDGSGVLDLFLTTLVLTLLLRGARDRDYLDDNAELESVSSAGLLILRREDRLRRMVLASIIAYRRSD